MIPNNIVRDSDSWFFTVDSLQFQLCELICMLSIFFSLLPGWLNCSRLKARPAFRTTNIEMKLSKKMQNLWPAGYGKITHLAGLSSYTISWQSVLKGVDSERAYFREEREGKIRHCSSSSNRHSARGTQPRANYLLFLMETCVIYSHI